jgi:hypothetical protein
MDNGAGLPLTHQLMNALLREVPGLLLELWHYCSIHIFDTNLWPFSTYMFKDPDIIMVHNTIMELSKLFILPSRGRYLVFSQQV